MAASTLVPEGLDAPGDIRAERVCIEVLKTG
jgi:hypothetical protein